LGLGDRGLTRNDVEKLSLVDPRTFGEVLHALTLLWVGVGTLSQQRANTQVHRCPAMALVPELVAIRLSVAVVITLSIGVGHVHSINRL
jgi:hypothetical protein